MEFQMIIRRVKNINEIGQGIAMYASVPDSTTVPCDLPYAITQIRRAYSEGRSCFRVIEVDSEMHGFIMATPYSFDYNPAKILLVRYYYSDLTGIKSAIALKRAHTSVIEYAIKNNMDFVMTSRNSRLDPLDKYGQILKRAGWIDRGSHLLFKLK